MLIDGLILQSLELYIAKSRVSHLGQLVLRSMLCKVSKHVEHDSWAEVQQCNVWAILGETPTSGKTDNRLKT